MLVHLRKRGFRYLLIKAGSIFFQRVRARILSLTVACGKGLRVGRNLSYLKDRASSIILGDGVHIHHDVELWSVMDKINDKPSLLKIGDFSQIKCNVVIKVKSGVMKMGSYVAVGHNSEILCDHENIVIGNGVRIAAEAFISTGNHNFSRKDAAIHEQGFYYKSVTIENDVWIGRRVIVLPGVTIGAGSIIAAGAVVTKDIEPYSVYAGIPARKVRSR
jgi:acetyltransferase-like isoleucine patch superfamily enzyme